MMGLPGWLAAMVDATARRQRAKICALRLQVAASIRETRQHRHGMTTLQQMFAREAADASQLRHDFIASRHDLAAIRRVAAMYQLAWQGARVRARRIAAERDAMAMDVSRVAAALTAVESRLAASTAAFKRLRQEHQELQTAGRPSPLAQPAVTPTSAALAEVARLRESLCRMEQLLAHHEGRPHDLTSVCRPGCEVPQMERLVTHG